MEIKLSRNQRYLDMGKKIKIGIKGAMVDVHPDFISFLPETAYTIVNATPISTSTPTEKTLDRMNWIELANKALEMNLIESIQKAQEQKLTKAQLIDIINGVNA